MELNRAFGVHARTNASLLKKSAAHLNHQSGVLQVTHSFVTDMSVAQICLTLTQTIIYSQWLNVLIRINVYLIRVIALRKLL